MDGGGVQEAPGKGHRTRANENKSTGGHEDRNALSFPPTGDERINRMLSLSKEVGTRGGPR